MTPDQYREEAIQFCRTAIGPLAKELVDWTDTGTLGEAPFFRALSEKCKLFAGVAYGRQVAENMVKIEGLRFIMRNGG